MKPMQHVKNELPVIKDDKTVHLVQKVQYMRNKTCHCVVSGHRNNHDLLWQMSLNHGGWCTALYSHVTVHPESR